MLFSLDSLIPAEFAVIQRIDLLQRRFIHAIRGTPPWGRLLRRSAFAHAIRGSNRIEGDGVSIEDAIAAVDKEEPNESQGNRWRSISGYRDAITYVMQLADDPHFTYSTDLIRALHFMMLGYNKNQHPGVWRTGDGYQRNESSGQIEYDGPDAELIPGLMDELMESLNSRDNLPAMVKAALAHLNLLLILPFSTGNGQIARGLQTLILAREGLLDPWFSGIEEYLGSNAPQYSVLLGEVGGGKWNPGRDPRPFVRFCLTGHYQQANTIFQRTREMTKIWDLLEYEVKSRKLPARALLALVDSAFGYRVRNSSYRAAANISLNLASRDLKALVDCGLLLSWGKGRGRYVIASDKIRQIREDTRETQSDQDPFEIA